MNRSISIGRSMAVGAVCGALTFWAGCKSANSNKGQPAPVASAQAPAPQPPPPSDSQIAEAIRTKIAAEPALNDQKIEVSVANGIATLNGQAANDASRSLAAADSGSVGGVRTVINDLTVAPPPRAAEAAPARVAHTPRLRQQHAVEPPPPAEAMTAPPSPPPPPAPEQVQAVPPPPPSPPPPVEKTVTLAAGTVIPVRMTDTLDSDTTKSNTTFHASLAAGLIVDGMVAAPRGSEVTGRVIKAKKAGHFSGSAELSLELTGIRTGGQAIALVTAPYSTKRAGRGKDTALKSGGGAALGAIIGALGGGGAGAAIGAATGGGIGAGVNGVTRGKEVKIPSETLLNFKLQSPVNVTTSARAGASRGYSSN